MNLLLHQCAHEFRKYRVFVLLFLALLFVAHLPSQSESTDWGYNLLNWSFVLLINASVGLLFLFLVAAPFLSDSPSKRDRPLTTRPLTPFALYGGKALFVFTALILPILSLNAALMLLHNEVAASLSLTTLDWLLVLSALALLITSFTLHQQSPLSLILSSLISILVLVSFWNFLQMLHELEFLPSILWKNQSPHRLSLFITALFLSCGLLLLLKTQSRKEVAFPRRFLSLAGLLLLSLIVANVLNRWSFQPNPHRKTLTSILTNPNHPIDIQTHLPNTFSIGDSGALTITIPKESRAQLTQHFPDVDYAFEFSRYEIQNLGEAHFESDGPSYREPQFYSIHLPSGTLAPGFERLLLKTFPDLRAIVPYGSWGQANKVNLPSSDSFRNKLPQTPFHLKGSIRILAGQWKIENRVPLNSPSKDNTVRIVPLAWNSDGLHFSLSKAKPRRLLFSKSEEEDSPDNRLCGLYLPSHQLIHFGEVRKAGKQSSSILLDHEELSIHFDSPQKGRINLLGAQLVFIEATKIGSAVVPYQSENYPPFPSHRRRPPNGTQLGEEIFHSGQFALWLRQNQPKANAPTSEVATFLYNFTSHLVRSLHRIHIEEDFLAEQLSPLVESHLSLFLSDLSRFEPNSSFAAIFTKAISSGIRRDDKDQLISAANDYPFLMTVLIERGWIQEGEAVFRKHLNHPDSGMQQRAVQGLLACNNPKNDHLLVSFVKKDPANELTPIILRHPRIKQALIKSRLGEPAPQIFPFSPSSNFPAISPERALALQLGDEQALEDLFFVLNYTQHTYRFHNNHPRRSLTKFFHFPRFNFQELQHRLSKHEPDDFRFDPIIERFVPKTNNSKD
ncbi:MAG: hypothetical protein ACSHYB_16720 [Roseibacillus sp.]